MILSLAQYSRSSHFNIVMWSLQTPLRLYESFHHYLLGTAIEGLIILSCQRSFIYQEWTNKNSQGCAIPQVMILSIFQKRWHVSYWLLVIESCKLLHLNGSCFYSEWAKHLVHSTYIKVIINSLNSDSKSSPCHFI